jgi:fumarate reductase flavoprotein subunit
MAVSPRGAEKARNLAAEIVIIGGGGAGLMAAIAAAQAGVKDIIVLEKASVPGGNTGISHGIFAINSPAQKRLGLQYSADEVFRDKMKYVSWRVDARLVRTVINRSADLIGWLENKGLRFDYVIQFVHEGEGPRTFHKYNADPSGGVGEKLVATLVRECQSLGVKLLCDTAAKKILTDKKGKVNGVLAKAKDKEFKVAARSVIIACGGFGGSKELLDRYFPYHGDVTGISVPQVTGDGLLMAEEVGAFIDNPVAINITGPGYMGSPGVGLLFQRPEMMLVNKNGERFLDESLRIHYFDSAASALSRQPGKVCYAMLDAQILRDIKQKREALSGLEKDMGRNGAWLNEVEDSLRKDIAEGKIKMSDTLDGIAGWIGVAPEVLKATVEQYNSFCDNGYDADFIKEKPYLLPLRTPPYYAIPGSQSFDTTMGGIRINHRAEVISRQDSPISGLYAAGDTATGCESVSYNHRYPGSALCFALVSGQIAGENAARYLSGSR